MKEKKICGVPMKDKPQMGARIQEQDKTFCVKCGSAVSVKWNFCPYCREPVKKNLARRRSAWQSGTL